MIAYVSEVVMEIEETNVLCPVCKTGSIVSVINEVRDGHSLLVDLMTPDGPGCGEANLRNRTVEHHCNNHSCMAQFATLPVI